MPHVRRWLFDTLRAASLVLCIAMIGLWIRSYFYDDAFHVRRFRPGWFLVDRTLRSSGGALEFFQQVEKYPRESSRETSFRIGKPRGGGFPPRLSVPSDVFQRAHHLMGFA